MKNTISKSNYTPCHFSGSKWDFASPNATEAAIQDIIVNQAIWNKFRLPSTRLWSRRPVEPRWRPLELRYSENVGNLGVFWYYPTLYRFSVHPSRQIDVWASEMERVAIFEPQLFLNRQFWTDRTDFNQIWNFLFFAHFRHISLSGTVLSGKVISSKFPKFQKFRDSLLQLETRSCPRYDMYRQPCVHLTPFDASQPEVTHIEVSGAQFWRRFSHNPPIGRNSVIWSVFRDFFQTDAKIP